MKPAGVRVLAPDWHAAEIGPPCESVEKLLAARHGPTLLRLAHSLGALHGVLIYRLARGFDRVGLVQKAPGTLTFAILEALVGRRRDRLVLLTFLPRELPRRPLRRLAYRAWLVLVERRAIRRSMRAAHVLTPSDQRRYARLYRLPPERFHPIRWALSRRGTPLAHDPTAREGVVSSGRAYCDWETLFAAARRGSWKLTVICSREDLAAVEGLNGAGRAEIHCELPREEHDRILSRAAVYALCVRDEGPSAGHVRLMAALDAGPAIVATDVPGLEGYVEAGDTALVVPPRDPAALAAAIEALLGDPARCTELATNAAERARGWTYEDLFGALRTLLVES